MLKIITILFILGGFLFPLFIIPLITDESFNFVSICGIILLLLGVVIYRRIKGTLADKKHRVFLIAFIVMILMFAITISDYLMAGIIYISMAIVFGLLWFVTWYCSSRNR